METTLPHLEYLYSNRNLKKKFKKNQSYTLDLTSDPSRRIIFVIGLTI